MKSTRPFVLRSRRILLKARHWTVLGFLLPFHFLKLRSMLRSAGSGGKNAKRVAINLTEHLGDIVACEPVVGYVRKKYPDAFVVWFVREPFRELIDSHPEIDRSFPLLCLTEWIVLRRLNLFDEVLDLHVEGRACPLCQIPLKKDTGDSGVTLDNYYEHGSLLAAFSKSAGIALRGEQPRVYISRKIVERIDALNVPDFLVTIHCSSNEATRDWQPRKWEEMVGGLLSDKRISCAEIGTTPVLKLNSPNFINLCGKLSILESAEVIRRSRLFIGVDSGPAQLANAAKTPGVILLGDYKRFRKYMPYSGFYGKSNNVDLIYSEGPVANLAASKVLQTVRRRLRRTTSRKK